MICTDCRPLIFDEPGIRTAVKLCDRHVKLEEENAELRQAVIRQAAIMREYQDKLDSVVKNEQTANKEPILI